MSIEAMKLALEAINDLEGEINGYRTVDFPIPEKAKSFLRQAIEQAQKQEPVAWWVTGPDGEIDWTDEPIQHKEQRPLEELVDGCGYAPLYTSPPQRQPDHTEDNLEMVEKQEPVAWCEQSELNWLNSDKRGASAYVKTMLSKRKDGLAMTPLYTPPPQRQPLTDEQMFEMAEIAWRHGWASCRDAEYVGEEAEDERWGMVGAEVVQDIAAHGIKEKNT